jgi:tripartite-type tricarboxylate transporter receptor subunit TctC
MATPSRARQPVRFGRNSMKSLLSCFRVVVALITAGFATGAYAQGAYPVKPVRIVVPFPPGGTNDIVARFIVRDLTGSMGQQFVVENRGGASGIIGAEAVAKSAPDGYTLMVHSSTHLSNAFAYPRLPYDTFRDFEPIGLLAAQPGILVVHPSLPVKTVKEFIALARSRPNQITYASNGEGGSLHVNMALFAAMTKVNLIHVPYKGGGPVAVSLASGETQASIATVGIVLPHLRSGRLRALGMTAASRSTILPAVPTIAEAGVPGYEMNSWIGVFAPANTPRAITDRLYSEMSRILKQPEPARQMADQGVEPWLGGQAEFAARLRSDYEKLQKVFKIIGSPKPS